MTIASDYGDAREVQRLIRDEVERAGFDPDSQFAIKLALEEALINAIKHGNKLDKRKNVQVEWRISAAAAEITIEDEGPGFDRKDVPNPTDEPNLEKLTGRGILLIESYMTDVQWSNGGRRVKLVKKNTPRPPGIKPPDADCRLRIANCRLGGTVRIRAFSACYNRQLEIGNRQ
jgi:serine/threonine-protein kinase RsbW